MDESMSSSDKNAADPATRNQDIQRLEDELRQARGEITRLQEQLEQKVSERTAELAQTNQEFQWEIFERKIAEEELRRTSATLNSILNSSTEFAVIAADLDFHILHFNPAAERFFGYNAREITGQSLPEIFAPPGSPPGESSRILEIVRKTGKSEHQSSIHLDTGEKRYIHSVIMPMKEDEDQITGLILVAQDVTGRIRAAEQQRRAVKKAREASRLKSQILASVSHEIRTPLSCIMGFTESILATRSVPEIRAHAKTMLQETEGLLSLINDLLDHAKIEAGKLDLEFRPVNLRLLMDQIMNISWVQANKKRLEFKMVLGEDIPGNIMTDALRLKQVLINLISNAIKFTQRGHVLVKVETVEKENHMAMLCFSVEDTGIGIPKEKQESIFESFSQADGSTTRRYGGTGLGVTISRGLVEAMGGVLQLESQPGKGSRFWFKFAADIPTSGQAEITKETLFSKPGLKKTSRPAHILLAEDYIPNQTVVRMHLESGGHQVTITENGQEALAACTKNNFDLIILDYHMPVMDGCEAARLIRAGDWPSSKVPILALTAGGDSDSRRACKKAGMDGVLTKPIRRADFLNTIHRWLAQKDHPGQSTPQSHDCPQAEKQDNHKPIDFPQALQEFSGNKRLLSNILNQFIKQVESQLPLLNKAIQDNDSETLWKEAHKIRGGAANLSALPLTKAAERLENAGKSGRVDAAKEILEEFEKEFNRLKDVLRKPSRP
jgi:PAS domain S-box-containing protein